MRNDQGTQDTTKGYFVWKSSSSFMQCQAALLLRSWCCAVVGYIKLALQAGKANPAPPVGPALGAKVHAPSCYVAVGAAVNASRCLGLIPLCWATPVPTSNAVSAHMYSVLTTYTMWHAQGLNIMAFCKEYNAATQDKVGTVIPVEITCFEV